MFSAPEFCSWSTVGTRVCQGSWEIMLQMGEHPRHPEGPV